MLYPDISSTRSANFAVASNTAVLCALAAIILAFSGEERIFNIALFSLFTVKFFSAIIVAARNFFKGSAFRVCSSLMAEPSGIRIEGRPIIPISATEDAPDLEIISCASHR